LETLLGEGMRGAPEEEQRDEDRHDHEHKEEPRSSRGGGRVPLAVPHRLDRLVGADPAQVHLRRRDARVAERVAHDVERRAGAHEVDGERVAQPVRVHPALYARPAPSLGSRWRTYDRSSGLPARLQKRGPPPGMPRFRRASSQRPTDQRRCRNPCRHPS